MPQHKFTDELSSTQYDNACAYYEFLINDELSTNNQRKCIIKNLIKKWKKGVYDREKAVKLFLYLCNNNKHRFNDVMLLPNVRLNTASQLEDHFYQTINDDQMYNNDNELIDLLI
jgi:hypothetical protein